MEAATSNIAQLNLSNRPVTASENSNGSSSGRKSRGGGLSRIPRPVGPATPSGPRPGISPSYSYDSDLPPRSQEYPSPPGSIGYREGSDTSSYTTENERLTPVSSSSGSVRKTITPKVNSFGNIKHAPAGGNVHVFHQKLDFSDVSSKCQSKANMRHKAGGGDIQVFDQKLKFKETASSKVGSFKNAKHVAGGGDKKIEDRQLNWDTSSRVGSWQNAKHKPGGGDVKIENRSLNWDTSSKVGSWKNFKHKPGGGNVEILDERLEWTTEARTKHRLAPKKAYGYQEQNAEQEEYLVDGAPIETDLDAVPEAVSP